MTTYIMRRLMHAVLVVLIVSLMVFLIMRLLPGDPILMYVTSGDLQSVSKEQIQQLRHELGMDRPLLCSISTGWAMRCGATWGNRSSITTT